MTRKSADDIQHIKESVNIGTTDGAEAPVPDCLINQVTTEEMAFEGLLKVLKIAPEEVFAQAEYPDRFVIVTTAGQKKTWRKA